MPAAPSPAIPGVSTGGPLALPPPAPPVAPSSAQAPVYQQTSLVLTPDQLTAFKKYLRERIIEERKNMGLEWSANRTRGTTSGVGVPHSSRWSSGVTAVTDSWAYKREVNQQEYDGNFNARTETSGAGNIFLTSNRSIDPGKRWVRVLSSRLNEVQLATEPWWAAMPQQAMAGAPPAPPALPAPGMPLALPAVGATPQTALAGPATPGAPPPPPPKPPASANPATSLPAPPPPPAQDNSATAKAVEAYCQGFIGKSNLREVLQEARRAALIRNDATVKLSWVKRATSFVGPARVMVNGPQVTAINIDGSPLLNVLPLTLSDGSVIAPGAPIRLPSGDYVFEHDVTMDALPIPGQPTPPPPGAQCLLKDPTFLMPPPGLAVYQNFANLPQIEVDYEGLDAATVFFKDYIFPISCRSLKEADLHCHVYDATLNELRKTFGGFDSFEQYADRFRTSEASAGAHRPGRDGARQRA